LIFKATIEKAQAVIRQDKQMSAGTFEFLGIKPGKYPPEPGVGHTHAIEPQLTNDDTCSQLQFSMSEKHMFGNNDY
jgi:hypothetical protein